MVRVLGIFKAIAPLVPEVASPDKNRPVRFSISCPVALIDWQIRWRLPLGYPFMPILGISLATVSSTLWPFPQRLTLFESPTICRAVCALVTMATDSCARRIGPNRSKPALYGLHWTHGLDAAVKMGGSCPIRPQSPFLRAPLPIGLAGKTRRSFVDHSPRSRTS